MLLPVNEDELIGNWTLAGDELEQLSGRRGATKLGFALLLRFYAVHGVNDYIRFGKRGELASNRHEEQELGMLCLHILGVI